MIVAGQWYRQQFPSYETIAERAHCDRTRELSGPSMHWSEAAS